MKVSEGVEAWLDYSSLEKSSLGWHEQGKNAQKAERGAPIIFLGGWHNLISFLMRRQRSGKK